MAFGGGLENDDEVMSEINVTPLVDVMLVLLIIFILTVPVLTHTVTLELPQAQNQPNVIELSTVTIAIAKDGTILWDGEALTEAALDARLEALAAQEDQPEIQIRGDTHAEYGSVVKAMAAAQRAGIKKLGFITKPD
ncbi:biopolymer transporter ExbD [Oxalobacter vibrioformis]|uniref:Biopolymer transporter ExbD n=1 Tax=Oxalobacter vibrioformis TaxID=933080 RepID=A0A9E9P3I9_9BURK|nr:biopolymer transporter ExbD [Oxalobacter vibrioformis]WAW10275.1 biopolymer transporter ExbD [Oxalobacter vibrioformis]